MGTAGGSARDAHPRRRFLQPDVRCAPAGTSIRPAPLTGEHTRRNHPDHHAGDLPNLEVDKRLRGRANVTSAHFMLSADATKSLFDGDGSAIVIHANVDDFTAGTTETGPGNSGARIACGVITIEGVGGDVACARTMLARSWAWVSPP